MPLKAEATIRDLAGSERSLDVLPMEKEYYSVRVSRCNGVHEERVRNEFPAIEQAARVARTYHDEEGKTEAVVVKVHEEIVYEVSKEKARCL